MPIINMKILNANQVLNLNTITTTVQYRILVGGRYAFWLVSAYNDNIISENENFGL